MTSPTSNPLLDFTGLTHFDKIAPDHVEPAIQYLLEDAQRTIDALAQAGTPATWDDFVIPMTEATEHLGRAWGVVGHMHSVMDTPEWRTAYNKLLPEISRFFAELGQNQGVYEKFHALAKSTEYARLNGVRQRIIDHELRDFRLSGAELPDEQKPRFKEIQEALSSLAAGFSENLLDSTNAFAEYVTDEAELAGLPEDVIHAARAAAEKEGKDGWKFTLHMPSYLPVMQYADSARLRETMYRAYATRASEHGDGKWDNGPLMGKILALRAEEARMLGFESYAELSVVPKMADSPAQVLAFLNDLAHKAKPFAERDLAELKAFADEQLGMREMNPWDVAYASEKLREARYAFSENEVRQYFPEPKVLDGLFGVIESLYGVSLKRDSAPTWDPSVTVLRIERDGQMIGQLYLDLHARETKRGGAWMDSARSRQMSRGRLLTPVAYVVCNFSPPVGDKPATLTHDDVTTLFHEFGHALHHLLTEVDEVAVSGIHGVEWDAVELPSQFMENFCWEWDVVSGMSSHVNTGEPLPQALFDKMVAARHFQSGMQMVRQLEFSLFDLRLHHEIEADAPVAAETVLKLLDDVRKQVAVLIPPAWHRFPHSFSHIFAGGYSAGYYSYKWAEVLSADAFAAFEEAGQGKHSLLDRATGERFWREVLAVGGSRPAIESFRAFRGREPQVEALLRHSGMLETTA
ncbi:M3 family metallopeptidase [Nitrogeniibacter aestuarii]|uniref:M3 family metallopeptidase n=1 Tax=Nitrogeniibacter aestuarii TaxID=2815343 RepID=UPI001D10B195|nr:M3 family metallopeptidase [Nitrogeniibacter aestuarii]